MNVKFIIYALVVSLICTLLIWGKLLGFSGSSARSGSGSSWSSSNSGGGSWSGGGHK